MCGSLGSERKTSVCTACAPKTGIVYAVGQTEQFAAMRSSWMLRHAWGSTLLVFLPILFYERLDALL